MVSTECVLVSCHHEVKKIKARYLGTICACTVGKDHKGLIFYIVKSEHEPARLHAAGGFIYMCTQEVSTKILVKFAFSKLVVSQSERPSVGAALT